MRVWEIDPRSMVCMWDGRREVVPFCLQDTLEAWDLGIHVIHVQHARL